MKRILVILLIITGIVSPVLAQKGRDETLANSYFQTGEYEKAAAIYQTLWDKANNAPGYYRPLFKSLLELKKYEDAERVARRQAKKFPDIIQYQVDVAYILQLMGDANKSKEAFEKLIKNIRPEETEIHAAANAMGDYRVFGYQIALYERAGKLFKGHADYSLDIAGAYLNMGDYVHAANHYIDHIDRQPEDGQTIKNTILAHREAPKLMGEMETQLYARLQKDPNQESYAELLAWIYIQNKDFEGALVQTKALDRRRNDNGIRVLEVARMAQTEGFYTDAVNGYEYVIGKMPRSVHYFQAKTELLNCRKEKIAKTINYSQEDLQALKAEYSSFLEENGKNPRTAQSMKEMADLVGFYLHQSDSAIAICQEVVDMPGLPQPIVNQAKLSLGDFYLISGDVWESSLLYSQVDKEEKDGPLGEEARFKNAKLSYYKGDFEWAQEQLQVLKSSTSELIANDAINLSVFIIDNLGLDTVPAPMQLFASADLLMFQNNDEEARKKLDTIILRYPGHALYDDIAFAKAQIYVRHHEYAKAVPLLEEIIKNYGHDLKGDDATFLLAELCEKELHNIDRAKELYKSILTDYNSSLLVLEARKRYRILRGDKLD